MLRPIKFRPFEKRILCGIALLLICAGAFGVIIGIRRADWRILLASVGVLGFALIYLLAARRGKPL